MSYFVEFDEKTGIFSARHPDQPLIIGEGATLYTAIDSLEANLSAKALADNLEIGREVHDKKEEG